MSDQTTTALLASNESNDDTIEQSLTFVRTHLGMEVSYLSEFVDDKLVYRAVDAPGFENLMYVGGEMPLDLTYCRHICEGRLPELIPDTADIPFTQTIPLTHAVPIRSHVSIPIHRKDGSVFGMFCSMSRSPNPSLNQRDLDVMRAFSNVTAEQINTNLATKAARQSIVERLTDVMENKRFAIVYQPINDNKSRRPMGFEALTRFQSDPYVPPNIWFDEALTVGLQMEMELAVIAEALKAFEVLPDDIYLSVNVSPQTVASGVLKDALSAFPMDRIVLEITEHMAVCDYETLLDELMDLRMLGFRVAVDDAGAGYSGLQHIVQLKPDIIKLDISLTSNIDQDVVRRSLGVALTQFAQETNCKIVAEGIETEAELQTLCEMGVPLGQGYLLGRPMSLEDALRATEITQPHSQQA